MKTVRGSRIVKGAVWIALAAGLFWAAFEWREEGTFWVCIAVGLFSTVAALSITMGRRVGRWFGVAGGIVLILYAVGLVLLGTEDVGDLGLSLPCGSVLLSLAADPRTILRAFYVRLSFPGISNPTFIIGCGRSGTTVLGTSLSKHRNVTYLNEPRHLWFSALPETDIWTSKAHKRTGRLLLTEANADSRKSKKLSRSFRLETIISGRPVLIEKLPINSFRLELIDHIFPDARFIHIFRNGLEVASSIEKESKKGNWFGATSYKWNQLVDYAMRKDDTRGLPALCTTYHDMGLLEWRLSTEAVVAFLRRLPDTKFVEINYDEFVASPVEAVLRLQDFIGVDRDPEVAEFVSNRVVRKSSHLAQVKLSAKDQMLGGQLLPLSMDGGKGLTKRATDCYSATS